MKQILTDFEGIEREIEVFECEQCNRTYAKEEEVSYSLGDLAVCIHCFSSQGDKYENN